MKAFLLSSVVIAGVGSMANAATYTLDFSGDICDGPCSNGTTISQSYGDTSLVDVSHDYTSSAVPGLAYWGTGYSDLSGVAWGGDYSVDNLGTISFTPIAGYKVSVLSFDIGSWSGSSSTTVGVYDGAGSLVGDLGMQFIDISSASTFTGDWSSDSGIEIRWANAWQFAIDNITFSVTEIDTGTPQPAPIPLPASAFLLLAGLGSLGFARRRRRSVA